MPGPGVARRKPGARAALPQRFDGGRSRTGTSRRIPNPGRGAFRRISPHGASCAGTASWERGRPARIDRRRPRHPICGRDARVPRTPCPRTFARGVPGESPTAHMPRFHPTVASSGFSARSRLQLRPNFRRTSKGLSTLTCLPVFDTPRLAGRSRRPSPGRRRRAAPARPCRPRLPYSRPDGWRPSPCPVGDDGRVLARAPKAENVPGDRAHHDEVQVAGLDAKRLGPALDLPPRR